MKEPSSQGVQIPNFRQCNGSQLWEQRQKHLPADEISSLSHWAGGDDPPASAPDQGSGPWPHSPFDPKTVVCRLHLESYWKLIIMIDSHSRKMCTCMCYFVHGISGAKSYRSLSKSPLNYRLLLSTLRPPLPLPVSATGLLPGVWCSVLQN